MPGHLKTRVGDDELWLLPSLATTEGSWSLQILDQHAIIGQRASGLDSVRRKLPAAPKELLITAEWESK